ncbi:MAG: hypothetical protein JKY52_11495 [Flavobacteriales bacterium]|nr:hypothetical protein [Flavobacteriales bacterium]
MSEPIGTGGPDRPTKSRNIQMIYRLKRIAVMLLLATLGQVVTGAPIDSDSAAVKSHHWIVPDYGKLQFAGNIGVGSIGVGYQYAPKLTLEIFAGYLPKIYSKQPMYIFTVKNSYFPMQKELKGDYLLRPLGVGFFVSYSTSDNLFTTTRSLPYDFSYYGFATSIRTALTFESSITKQIRKDYPGYIKSIGFYDEISIVDIDLVNFVQNHKIGFHSILSIALGVRLSF